MSIAYFNDNFGADKANIARAAGLTLLGFGEHTPVGALWVTYSERGMFGIYRKQAEGRNIPVERYRDFARVCKRAAKLASN